MTTDGEPVVITVTPLGDSLHEAIRLGAPEHVLASVGPYGFRVDDGTNERWAETEQEANCIGDRMLRVAKGPERGWYGMACFNGLSEEQQRFVVEEGYLPFGYRPEGTRCLNGAQVMIETMWDEKPGPRAYCTGCAIEYLEGKE